MQRIDEGCKIWPWQSPSRSTLGTVLVQLLHSFTSAVRLPFMGFSLFSLTVAILEPVGFIFVPISLILKKEMCFSYRGRLCL